MTYRILSLRQKAIIRTCIYALNGDQELIDATEIANRLCASPSGIASSLWHLERRGIIERRMCKGVNVVWSVFRKDGTKVSADNWI